ncbi:potassium-transporting ATPase subunit KdpC [Devosia beringensis]|uniref:potassium-transporting ATPase subunit KdpC n=1 Tax=Devosia beringensis TaxID=2657486 RepID=UPI00186B9437|nr:potassium-transporting ATPase subunit KdpC [Devosia beringensis]
MLNQIRPAIVMTVLFTLLTGLVYPLAITGFGQLAFPAQANGSRLDRDGIIIGSALIGQDFTQPGYFWPRPSATGPAPYNAAASSGSNLGATDARLVARVDDTVASLGGAPLPADAATTSASGLDPDISPANARQQLPRIAAARGVPLATLEALLADKTALPILAIFGEPRVNVLALNLALDQQAPLAR